MLQLTSRMIDIEGPSRYGSTVPVDEAVRMSSELNERKTIAQEKRGRRSTIGSKESFSRAREDFKLIRTVITKLISLTKIEKIKVDISSARKGWFRNLNKEAIILATALGYKDKYSRRSLASFDRFLTLEIKKRKVKQSALEERLFSEWPDKLLKAAGHERMESDISEAFNKHLDQIAAHRKATLIGDDAKAMDAFRAKVASVEALTKNRG